MTDTHVQATTHRGHSGTAGPGLSATVTAEALKLHTLTFPKVLGLVAIVLAVCTAAFFLVTIEATQGDSLGALSAADVASTALLGVDATAIALIILGGWLVATEYSTGMIHTSLVVTPNRAELFTAKMLVTAVLGIVAGLLAAVSALLTAQLVLSVQGLPGLNPVDSELLRMAFGSLLMVPFYAVVAAGAAFAVRSTGGAALVALAVMFIPALANMLPAAAQEIVLPLLPSTAIASISGAATADGAAHVAPVLAVVSLLVWWAVCIGAGLARFVRRDV